MRENSPAERLYNGIIKENPTFVLVLGMCPTLAVTTAAINGIGMGLTTTAVLLMSNLFISLLRNIIPDKVRMPAYIVIVASFVTVVELLLEGFIPSLYDSLGIYIPLIVVNCIILGRAESFASKNTPVASIFDGIGMGLGFTLSITILAAFRELVQGPCLEYRSCRALMSRQPSSSWHREPFLYWHFWRLCVPGSRIRNQKKSSIRCTVWKAAVQPAATNPAAANFTTTRRRNRRIGA